MGQSNIHLCDYGCGQEAKYQFKNGKWCCSENFRSCPKVRKKGKPVKFIFYNNSNKLCEYGCGQIAKYQFKNGKWCCSKSHNLCPSKIKKHSIYMKDARKDPTSKYNLISFIEKQSKSKEEMWKDPNNIYNSTLYRKRLRSGLKKIWKDPDSIFNSASWREKQSDIIKNIYKDPKSIYNSISYRNKLKLDIEKINKRHTTFSKEEELRYNPDKPDEKEIQVHCKNHECENSKEKGGWFTPTGIQLYERIRQLESKYGNGGSYFYCCQYCKDTCPLYYLRNDPYKETNLPYTYTEYQLWRKTVLELDKGLCYFCGKQATDVHHIKPVKTHPHLALDPDNGISFCEECHYKIGHKTGTECSTGNLANKQQGCSLGGQN